MLAVELASLRTGWMRRKSAPIANAWAARFQERDWVLCHWCCQRLPSLPEMTSATPSISKRTRSPQPEEGKTSAAMGCNAHALAPLQKEEALVSERFRRTSRISSGAMRQFRPAVALQERK